MFIDVYTDWCGWCKHMMKTTFANKGIANYINTQYIPVRFDAETLDTITFRGNDIDDQIGPGSLFVQTFN